MLAKRQKLCSIPALKNAAGQGVREAPEKAHLFATTFSSKYKMPDEMPNEFTANTASGLSMNNERTPTPDEMPNEFTAITASGLSMNNERTPTLSSAQRVLEQLDPCSATGPDELPTRILHESAASLALPLLLLACQILRTGCWPSLWLMHWIVPLHKKHAVFKPGNYRGIHLTAQLSKVMERLLGRLWLPDLAKQPSLCGPNQFAYLPEKGARDALAVMVCTWLLGFQQGQKFGLYCSDVSGAFDKVDAQRLLAKLRGKGFRLDMLQVIASVFKSALLMLLVVQDHNPWNSLTRSSKARCGDLRYRISFLKMRGLHSKCLTLLPWSFWMT